MPRTFEYTEHTADLGFKAYGQTLAEMFSNAATALFHVMFSEETIRCRQQHEVEVRASHVDDLLVRWLNELLYLMDGEGFLAREYAFDHLDGSYLKATVKGESLDPSRHRLKTGVKAVTYHDLSVQQKNNRWECRVLLDL